MIDKMQAERMAYDFAGMLVQEYVETISLLVGLQVDDREVRRQLLMKVRETELAKVDAIERQLGLEPRTAEIRSWYKANVKGSK